jgi:ferric-dicitrate binding protein FerR (iron transport regulator)
MKEELLIKYVAGQCTSQEEKEIYDWINQSPENKEEYYKFLNLWALSSQERSYEEASQKDIKIFKEFIADKSKQTRIQTFSLVLKYAAVALIAMVVGKYFIPEKTNKNESFALQNQIIVPLGSKSKIILPDGSTALLNAGSKLSYDFSYGNNTREVILEGEAYFKVAKNKGKPFIVHTSKANIKALGTEFNVKAYPEENRIETILVEGSILVEQKSGKSSKFNQEQTGILLKPGQKMLISEENKSTGSPTVASRDDKNVKEDEEIKLNREITDLENVAIETSWKDDRWIIQGEKLDDLAVLLSRRFNVAIQLMDSTLKEYKFSGTIQNETIEQIFDILKLTVPMTYTIEKGKAKWYINTNLEEDYNEVYKKKNN